MTTDAQASLGRLQRSTRARVLFVGHSGGGGVGRHMADLSHALEPDVEVLILQPDSAPFVALQWLRSGEKLKLWFDAGAWDELVDFLRTLGLDRIHYHHVDGLPESILDLPARLGRPHDVTLHDYFAVCPAYHLADANDRYCGMQPDCQKCLDKARTQWPLTIAQWRARFGALLATAARVIAPSEDAAERIRAFFPQVSALVWPHPEIGEPPPPRPLRVLVPGAISTLKGIHVLNACVADAAQRNLPLHFVVLGFLGLPLPQWPEAPLSVTGEYPEGMLAALIANERGDVLFFPSQVPETYSYTLSDALRSGLPIVASDLGAIGERLRGRPGTRTLPWDTPAAAMNDALLMVAPMPGGAALPSVRMTTFEAYRESYLAGLGAPGAGTHPAHYVEVLDRWLIEPAAPAESLPLAYYFEDGVVCGKARSLEQLRLHAFNPDAAYAAREGRFKELLATLWAERAEAARVLADTQAEAARATAQATVAARALEERLREIHGSTSWRLTSPLRRLVGWLRTRS